jgi:hypothetical protein
MFFLIISRDSMLKNRRHNNCKTVYYDQSEEYVFKSCEAKTEPDKSVSKKLKRNPVNDQRREYFFLISDLE